MASGTHKLVSFWAVKLGDWFTNADFFSVTLDQILRLPYGCFFLDMPFYKGRGPDLVISNETDVLSEC